MGGCIDSALKSATLSLRTRLARDVVLNDFRGKARIKIDENLAFSKNMAHYEAMLVFPHTLERPPPR